MSLNLKLKSFFFFLLIFFLLEQPWACWHHCRLGKPIWKFSIITFWTSQTFNGMSWIGVIIPIVQMRKPKPREVVISQWKFQQPISWHLPPQLGTVWPGYCPFLGMEVVRSRVWLFHFLEINVKYLIWNYMIWIYIYLCYKIKLQGISMSALSHFEGCLGWVSKEVRSVIRGMY